MASSYTSGPTSRCHRLGHRVAEVRGQALPFDREQPVALEVPEGAVVRHHVETVRAAFQRPPRPVPPVERARRHIWP